MKKPTVTVVLCTPREEEARGCEISRTCDPTGPRTCKIFSSAKIIADGITALFCGYDVIFTNNFSESGARAPLGVEGNAKLPHQ